MRLLLLSLLAASAIGCASPRTATSRFHCRSQIPEWTPPEPIARVTEGPVGKVEFTVHEPRLERPPAHPPEGGEPPSRKLWCSNQRVRVVAESAPLQALARALSEAFGINVALEAEVAPVRLSIFAPEITVADLLMAIGDVYAVHLEEREAALRIQRIETWAKNVRARRVEEPLKIELLKMRDASAAEAFAAAYCHQLATSRGSASVLDSSVHITDTLSGVCRARQLKTLLDAPNALPTGGSCEEFGRILHR